jgi:hypothetical protein
MKSKQPTKPVYMRLPVADYNKALAISEQEDRHLADVLRRCVHNGLPKQKTSK